MSIAEKSRARTLPMPVVLLALTVLSLSGCATWRALVPGGVLATDSEWSGIKSGQPVSITASLDPRAAPLGPLLALLGQSDPLGVLLPVTLVGETQPRWVVCDTDLAAKCVSIPLNAEVHFAGTPIGPGLLWKPKRLTAANFND